jgi:hypothetical protein
MFQDQGPLALDVLAEGLSRMRVSQRAQRLTTLLHRLLAEVAPFVLHQVERDHDGSRGPGPAPESMKVTVAIWPKGNSFTIEQSTSTGSAAMAAEIPVNQRVTFAWRVQRRIDVPSFRAIKRQPSCFFSS